MSNEKESPEALHAGLYFENMKKSRQLEADKIEAYAAWKKLPDYPGKPTEAEFWHLHGGKPQTEEQRHRKAHDKATQQTEHQLALDKKLGRSESSSVDTNAKPEQSKSEELSPFEKVKKRRNERQENTNKKQRGR